MSISNYLNKLCNIKNDLVNILKPFNSSINSNSKYDELVTYVNTISNDALSTKVYTTYSNGMVKNIIGNPSALSNRGAFNEPVTIGNNVANCYRMFNYCSYFNQPVTIPDSVTNCRDMFGGCNNFNQPITIPDSVTDCVSMIQRCKKFNQPVTIGNSVTDCHWMFYNCANMNSNIYIKSNKVTNCTNMLYNHNTSKRINIHIPNTNSTMINLFIASGSYSIAGDFMTYTSSTNLYYNAAHNIYIYTNYSG